MAGYKAPGIKDLLVSTTLYLLHEINQQLIILDSIDSCNFAGLWHALIKQIRYLLELNSSLFGVPGQLKRQSETRVLWLRERNIVNKRSNNLHEV